MPASFAKKYALSGLPNMYFMKIADVLSPFLSPTKLNKVPVPRFF